MVDLKSLKAHGVTVIIPEVATKYDPVVTKKTVSYVQKKTKPKNFVCKECGSGFSSAKDLTRHNVVHTGEKPYACPHCDQRFSAPSSKSLHIKSIHDKIEEYPCPDCEKIFNQKSNMIKHYKTLHLNQVTNKCQQCNRQFNQLSALRRHIKIVHDKVTPHKCNDCDKKFSLAESLKKHREAIHIKSKDHTCKYCDYAATRADMLRVHVRKVHTKDWSYNCRVCAEKGSIWGCILPKEMKRHLQSRHADCFDAEWSLFEKSESRIQFSPSKKSSKIFDGIALSLIKKITEPLELSDQLQDEVRSRACEAPPGVVSINIDDESLVTSSERSEFVIHELPAGWVTTVADDGDSRPLILTTTEWEVETTGDQDGVGQEVVQVDHDAAGKLFIDYHQKQ